MYDSGRLLFFLRVLPRFLGHVVVHSKLAYAKLPNRRQMLERHAMVGSMSRRANCWDNAVAESFFASLKVELVYPNQWRTRAEARSAIFEYLESFYNRRRQHSALGYRSPVEFEDQMKQLEERTQTRAELFLIKKARQKTANPRHLAA